MEWSTEKEQERASAAARWLFDQVGIRGEWTRLGGFWPQTCLRRGVWYRILSHDPQSRTLQLGDDVEELDVNLTYLKVRADLPEKTVVFSEGKWTHRPPAEMTYVAVCPRGHEHRLGGAPPASTLCKCPECNRDYEWGWEDPAETET